MHTTKVKHLYLARFLYQIIVLILMKDMDQHKKRYFITINWDLQILLQLEILKILSCICRLKCPQKLKEESEVFWLDQKIYQPKIVPPVHSLRRRSNLYLACPSLDLNPLHLLILWRRSLVLNLGSCRTPRRFLAGFSFLFSRWHCFMWDGSSR